MLAGVLATPTSQVPRDVNSAAENAYYQATGGVKTGWDTMTHWDTPAHWSTQAHWDTMAHWFSSKRHGHTPKRVERGHQACRATDHVYWLTYHITIGADYDPARCLTLQDRLRKGESVSFWKCESDRDDDNEDEDHDDEDHDKGFFKIRFNTAAGLEVGLNEDLATEFHEINGFNCPGI